jgi:DNA (cytosine-5)-methyltransferase 1
MRRAGRTSGSRREIWSFFTGAMGLDLGLESAGLAPTLANEIERTYCETIRMNRPSLDLVEGDIASLTADGLRARREFAGDVHLMIGGPPCQPFSSGGKRAGLTDPRGNLIYQYFRLIAEVRPQYFILENVANLTTAALKHRPISERPGRHWNLKRYEDGWLPFGDEAAAPLEPDEMPGSALRQIVRDATALGYHIAFSVLDAADYGIAQHRLRFVLLGSRDYPPPKLPEPTHGPGRIPYRTVRDTIYHLRNNPGPHSEYTDPVARFFELVPEGKNWRALPKDLQREALGGAYESGGGKTGFFRRLAWSKPAPTITGRANRKGSALCHPAQVRPLSVAECAALQGFPRDWTFLGAMNTQYMQVGNAVPILLGQAIGQSICVHEGNARRRARVQHPDMDTMMAAAVARLRAAGRNKRPSRAA